MEKNGDIRHWNKMYNKLFAKILDSSIWLEPTSTRICWITLLAAMDEDGYAHFSAIENLANRARVTVEEARVAVECFLSPDKNSSDPEHDGRRVERVPGGFLILNAEKHRQTYKRLLQREQVRVRVERHRQKKREINGQTKKSSIIPPNGEPLPKESLEKLTADMRAAIELEKTNPVPP